MRRLLIASLANAAALGESLVGLANRFESAEGDEFVQLTPFGDFPHEKGIQRVDRKAAEAMANHFNSVASRVKRLFAGVPFYIGHPDVKAFANEFRDGKAYGWVKALEVREDGLYGKVEWSGPGKEMLANSHYKFASPHWNAETLSETKNGKKIFRPVELVSVGLTNRPNLPVHPLANEQESGAPDEGNKDMNRAVLIALLSLANEATDEQITEKIKSLAKSDADLVTTRTALENERTAKTNLETTLANTRKKMAETLADAAVKDGRITLANREQWVNDLVSDFEGKSVALANTKPTIKTEARTSGSRRTALANSDSIRERQKKVETLVNTKMKDGKTYDQAFNEAKEELANVFNEMETPEQDKE